MKLLLCEPKACAGATFMAQRSGAVGRSLSSKLEVEWTLGRSSLLFYLVVPLKPWKICKQPGEVGDIIDIRALSFPEWIMPSASVSSPACLSVSVLPQGWTHSLEVCCLLLSSLLFASLLAQRHVAGALGSTPTPTPGRCAAVLVCGHTCTKEVTRGMRERSLGKKQKNEGANEGG